MAAQVAENKLPGAVWLVAQGDDVVVDTVGVSAVGGTAPMRRDTIFRIASMTKPMTATAVMMLVEEGKLSARCAGRALAARSWPTGACSRGSTVRSRTPSPPAGPSPCGTC